MLYRQKLSSLLEKKSLTEADDESLREMQVGAGTWARVWGGGDAPHPPCCPPAPAASRPAPPPPTAHRPLLQVMLCIQESERAAMHAELCGALFKDAVNDALSGGIEGFGFPDRQAVAAAFRGLRMDRAAAREVLDTVARK